MVFEVESASAPQLSRVDQHRQLRFRGGLAFKAHRLCASLNSRLESNKEETKKHRQLPGALGQVQD